MNNKTKKSFHNKILNLVQNTSNPSDSAIRRKEIIKRGGIVFSFKDEFVDSFYDFIKDILNFSDWNEKFSEKYIKSNFESLLADVIKSSNKEIDVENYFENFINDLENYNREWLCIIPLSGIELHIKEYNIGKVKLVNATIDKLHFWFGTIENVIQKSDHSDLEKYMYIRNQSSEFLQRLSNYVCAELLINAEPIKALEIAENETRKIIDCLKYTIPVIYPESNKVDISLFGEIQNELRLSPILSADTNSFNLNKKLVGPDTTFVINDKMSQTFDKLGISVLSRIAGKSNKQLNDFDKTLFRGLHWFSSSLSQIEIENQLLNLFTSLETLLTPRDGNPIGTAIAENVAILISDNVDSRIELKARIKQLYKLRSALSHGGDKKIYESDLIELRHIVRIFLWNLIESADKFKSQKELFEYFEKQKFK